MRVHIEKRLFIEIGRGMASGRYEIFIGWGWNKDQYPNEISWRHWWLWQPRMPRLIRSRGSIIGFCAFGRCRVFR